ncbi:MAG TPA: cytochrome c maturation protein CcmE [Acidimicrobiales bacterium]|jgi:cytochrome c-type biogenesis protein CcmE|nr:cytochrome c maturation protein CcmE [Acidimicrobiales bacterium]
MALDDPSEFDDESPDAYSGELLVKPRRRLGSRRRQIIAFGVIMAALLVLVFRGLGNATEYFKTADEAVADRAQLGTKDFRIEGTVQPGVRQTGQLVNFVISNNGVNVPVVQHGEPPQLFKAGIPVVLDGHFDGPDSTTFDSNLIMVKHTASYVAAHPERVTTIPQPSGGSTP